MKKTSETKKKGRIWLKIFAITSLTFSTLLICGLFLQSYFFQKSYMVYKNPESYIAYNKLTEELRRSGTNAQAVAKILAKYRESNGLWAVIFLNDKVTEKYTPEDLGGYEYNNVLKAAIRYYIQYLGPLITDYNSAFSGDYRGVDGKEYDLYASTLYASGETIFAIGPSSNESTPGLVDQYFIYILMIGTLTSLILSYIFSIILSRPLIRINTAAQKMALLDFSEKIATRSNDELGQLSDSLNRLSDKLNDTLGELTAANAQLEKDIEKERNLEKTRKEFIANVSHELKTPLAIIKGYSEAIQDNIRADKTVHYIQRIVKEADNMNKLVQDMLDLTHIEAGRYKLQKTNFDLVMLVEHVVDSLQFLVMEKDLHISCHFSRQALSINADRIKMGQVVTNFVHNAIRHTPPCGHIHITVSETSGTIRLSVENEGNQIQNEKLDKVWERFYREKEDRNKKTGGSGLGLAISATILKLHNMPYGVTNTERGVMFYFEYTVE